MSNKVEGPTHRWGTGPQPSSPVAAFDGVVVSKLVDGVRATALEDLLTRANASRR